MCEPPSKRQRLSPQAASGLNPSDETPSAREALIASLLSGHNERPRKRALVEDLSDGSPITRPSFDMPDLSGSSSLLARVQSFLPQMQQANSSLSATDGSAFELVEEQDDEDAQEEADDIRYGEYDEAPLEDEEPDPQIIIDLALGVLEEKHSPSSSSESDSDGDTSSEEEDSSSDEASKESATPEVTDSIAKQPSASIQRDDAAKTENAPANKTESRKLIQELD